jgi:hypothetical protein
MKGFYQFGYQFVSESETNTCTLKVPKRDNFLLVFFALSEPIWVGDLGTKQKKNFFAFDP